MPKILLRLILFFFLKYCQPHPSPTRKPTSRGSFPLQLRKKSPDCIYFTYLSRSGKFSREEGFLGGDLYFRKQGLASFWGKCLNISVTILLFPNPASVWFVPKYKSKLTTVSLNTLVTMWPGEESLTGDAGDNARNTSDVKGTVQLSSEKGRRKSGNFRNRKADISSISFSHFSNPWTFLVCS